MNGWAELEGKKGRDEGFGEQNDNEKKASGWREGETVSTEKICSVVLHMFANARVMETSVHTCDCL